MLALTPSPGTAGEGEKNQNLADLGDAVRDYYDQYGEREWGRLERPADGTIEFALHSRAFVELLPPAPAHIADIGGGPGRWALCLAERGYTVTLSDLSPRLVEIARARVAEAAAEVRDRVASVEVCDARDLAIYPDGAFDAVLSLGPFYHLTGLGDRDRAAGELYRVLRPGGRAFVAVMPRYQWLLSTILSRGSAAFPGAVRRILEDGVYEGEAPGRFTGGALFRPVEVAPFFEGFGFRTLRLMASQGFLSLLQEETDALRARDPEAYEKLLDLAYETAADPSLHGLAGHLLYVGEKKPVG